MQPVPADNLELAVELLEADGFVVLENAVSETEAAELAELVLTSPDRASGVSGYEFFVSLFNHDTRFLKLAMHPAVLALARHLLGGRTEPVSHLFMWPPDDQVRLGTVDGLVAHPGSELGWWHMDPPMGQLSQSRPLPDFPFVVNSIWMLTPFTKETGATRVMPGSHALRRLPPATQGTLDGELDCVGPPGSVAIIPTTTWHAAGANRSSSPRIGVA